jgi:hypothetical protein
LTLSVIAPRDFCQQCSRKTFLLQEFAYFTPRQLCS